MQRMKNEMKEHLFIEERLELIEQKLDMLISLFNADNRYMSMQEIADYYGVSKQSLYKEKRYLLPDFGKQQAEGKRNTYTCREVMEWSKQDLRVLKDSFQKQRRMHEQNKKA